MSKNQNKRLKTKEFKLPNGVTLSGRKSTIAKSFSDGIAPRLPPTNDEHDQFLQFFPKKDGKHECAYCGLNSDYYEHFRPLVKDKIPTGYGSDIYNLVPSCKSCSEKKGNSDWQSWMDNLAKKAPNSVGHKLRFENLCQFENWGKDKVLFVDYVKLVGDEKWARYLSDYNRICETIDEMKALQNEIRNIVKIDISLKEKGDQSVDSNINEQLI